MGDRRSFFAELRRRNVWRAAVLYAGAAWALSQGIAQLGPAFGMPAWGTRWFVIACIIGFPFWIAFAWFYELTPQGIRRDSEVAVADPTFRRATRRKLDVWIIGVMALAIVLLVTNQFVLRRDATSRARATDAKAIAATLAKVPERSIAVLPFENLSSDKQNDYFVSGMQDLILTRLADIGDFKVISRTSTLKYKSRPDNLKQIAAELGVATLLEGSVQKAGNQVLINVQLIDTRTDTHLWAETYKRTLDDIFGVEGEVAGRIASSLHAKLSPARSGQLARAPTTNKAAYDLYLRAEYQINRGYRDWDQASSRKALALYRQAVHEDPDFALAWARLSMVDSYIYFNFRSEKDALQLKAQGRADAERALRLQPGLAFAHIALGYSRYWGYHDYAGALKAFDAALALRPNDPEAYSAKAWVLRRMDRLEDAVVLLKRSLVCDPRNTITTFAVGQTYVMLGRYSEAEPWLKRALALDPDNLNARDYYSQSILLGSGDAPRALAALRGDSPRVTRSRIHLLETMRRYRDAIALVQRLPETSSRESLAKTHALARMYRLAGDMARARPLYARLLARRHADLARLEGAPLADAWWDIAFYHACVGHPKEALEALDRSRNLMGAARHKPAEETMVLNSAFVYAQLRRPNQAVPLLAKSLAHGPSGDYSPVMLWLDPDWDPIRTDPGFQAVLRQYARYKPPKTFLPGPTGDGGD